MRKLFVFIIGIFLAGVILVFVFRFLIFKNSTQATDTSINTPSLDVPGSPQSIQTPQQGLNSSFSDDNATTTIQESFLTQVPNLQDPLFTFRNLALVYPYAIQHWTDDEAGGAALLKYDPAKGWVVVVNVGGALDIQTLVNLGVPSSTAQELISQ